MKRVEPTTTQERDALTALRKNFLQWARYHDIRNRKAANHWMNRVGQCAPYWKAHNALIRICLNLWGHELGKRRTSSH